MTNLDSTFKSRDITLPTKVYLVKGMVFPVVMCGCESWTIKKAEHWSIDSFELWCGEDSQESLGLQGDPISPCQRKSVLNIHWKGWWWSWNSNTWPPDVKNWLIWKDPDAGKDWRREEKGDDREWHGSMTSVTLRTGVWVISGNWWWTACCSPWGLQGIGHDWATELNWSHFDMSYLLIPVPKTPQKI